MPSPTPSDPHEHEHEHEHLRERFEHLVERVEEAAIAAEFDTGEREETIEEAKSHALVRLARMTLGTVVVLVGIAALPLPGPGWLIIAGGLTILARDVAWADRLLRYIRKRVPGIPEDGRIPRSSMVTMALVTMAAISASLWWTLARGSDDFQAGSYVVTELTDSALPVPVTDPGIEVELPIDGPVRLLAAGCEPVELSVTGRSKSSVEIDGVDDPAWSCANESAQRFIAGAGDGGLQLGYSTEGIVKWFLADNQLSSITTRGDAGDIQLAVSST